MLVSDYFLAARNTSFWMGYPYTFLVLTSRKPRELQRWKSEPGQLMPIWMSGLRFATLTKQFKIHDSLCFFFVFVFLSLSFHCSINPLWNRVLRTPNLSPTNQRRRSRRSFFDDSSGGHDSCSKALVRFRPTKKPRRWSRSFIRGVRV